MQDVCLNVLFVLGYIIGVITTAYYANQWDETADDAEEISYNNIMVFDDNDVDDLKTIQSAMSAAAVSQ